MILAERILVKKDWMHFSLEFVVFIDRVLFTLFHFFLVDDLFVIEIDVKQNLGFVFFQDVRIGAC